MYPNGFSVETQLPKQFSQEHKCMNTLSKFFGFLRVPSWLSKIRRDQNYSGSRPTLQRPVGLGQLDDVIVTAKTNFTDKDLSL
jgi:hypothetical protein